MRGGGCYATVQPTLSFFSAGDPRSYAKRSASTPFSIFVVVTPGGTKAARGQGRPLLQLSTHPQRCAANSPGGFFFSLFLCHHLNNDLARAVVVDDLELADVA